MTTPIQTKAQQLRARGFAIPAALVELPVNPLEPQGGQFVALPLLAMAIYQAPGATHAYEVHGAILAHYLAQGGPLGAFGYPETDEMDWYDATAKCNVFQKGVIRWDPHGNVDTRPEADKLRFYLMLTYHRLEALLPLSLEQAHAKIVKAERFDPEANWCGATLAYAFKAAGMDPFHTAMFNHTDPLLNYGSYYSLTVYGHPQAPPQITRLLPEKRNLRDVHAERGMLRKVTLWPELQSGTPLDILPGDIVLFDRDLTGGADHIQLVMSWYPEDRLLSVIDGNGAGFALKSMLEAQHGPNLKAGTHYTVASEQPEGANRVPKAQKIRWLKEFDSLDVLLPIPKDPKKGRFGVSCHLLTAAGQSNPASDTDNKPHARVFAIIRPSLMDFERHAYDTAPAPPAPRPHLTPIPIPVPVPKPHPKPIPPPIPKPR